MLLDVAATLDMDPDILVLASYLARKRGITLGELLERLITNDRLATNRETVVQRQSS